MGETPERVVVGRIVKPHGLHGELLVEVLSDAPDRFAAGSRLEAGPVDGPRRKLTIGSTRDDRGRMLVRFKEVPDRTAAEELHGTLLSIAGTEAAPLPEDTYYDWQLVGLAVEDEEGRPLGRLVRVDPSAAADLWIVDTGSSEVMVPGVGEFVRRVDLEGGRIVLHVIPGLFE